MLTEREKTILGWIIAGWPLEALCAAFHVKPQTIFRIAEGARRAET